MPQPLEHDVPQSPEQLVEQPLEQLVAQPLEHDVPQSLEQAVPQLLEQVVPQSLEHDVPQPLEQVVPQSPPQEQASTCLAGLAATGPAAKTARPKPASAGSALLPALRTARRFMLVSFFMVCTSRKPPNRFGVSIIDVR